MVNGNKSIVFSKISFVFPCWHAAKHMPHVLVDLQAQTFKDFEAILVNDGDDSQIEAMERIAAQDSRIRILRLPQNSGVAAARNAGTIAATTHWVTYPDPDDRFGPNYAQSLFDAADGKGVDMACGGNTTILKSTGVSLYNYIDVQESPEIMNLNSGYERMLSANCHKTAWNKLYNIELMRNNNLVFDTSFINAQDEIFNIKYFSIVKSIGLTKDCGYIYYYYDEGNNRNNYNPIWIQNRLEIISQREQFHRQIGWPEERIVEVRNKELAYDSLKMVRNLFASNSPLTLGDAAKKIEKEFLSTTKIVDAVVQWDYKSDHIMRLLQRLVRIGNARLIALVFKTLIIGKRHFGVFYLKTKSFFRGE